MERRQIMGNNLILKRFFTKNMLHNLLSEADMDTFHHVVRRYVKNPEGKPYEELIWTVNMYFPYLRGRQFELIAIRELLEKELIGSKIIPIIEPVKYTSTLAKTLAVYSEKEHKCALIMNPGVGNFVSTFRTKPHDEKTAIFNEKCFKCVGVNVYHIASLSYEAKQIKGNYATED